MTFAAAFRFDNSFARDLEGFYVARRPAVVPAPSLLYLNEPLANELGLEISALGRDAIAAIFAGNALPDGAQPLAQAYAGHQFGMDGVATSRSKARAARRLPAAVTARRPSGRCFARC